MGGAAGAGGGHGNMHSFGGGAGSSSSGSYGNQQQQRYHHMGGHNPFAADPTHQPLPPVSSMFEPPQGNYPYPPPPSYPPMGMAGFRDRGAGRPEVKKESDPTAGGKGKLLKYCWNLLEYIIAQAFLRQPN